jgi:hypothetical protein
MAIIEHSEMIGQRKNKIKYLHGIIIYFRCRFVIIVFLLKIGMKRMTFLLKGNHSFLTSIKA